MSVQIVIRNCFWVYLLLFYMQCFEIEFDEAMKIWNSYKKWKNEVETVTLTVQNMGQNSTSYISCSWIFQGIFFYNFLLQFAFWLILNWDATYIVGDIFDWRQRVLKKSFHDTQEKYAVSIHFMTWVARTRSNQNYLPSLKDNFMSKTLINMDVGC